MRKRVKKGEFNKRIEAFHKACRSAGLRVTPQRTAVYKSLLESGEHPSAGVVFRRVREVFPAISMDTVNRTLRTLNEIGAVSVIEGIGNARRFDGNPENHQHFKCVKCKRIIDFHHKPFDNIKLPTGLSRRFTVLRRTVYLEGVCDMCRRE